MKPRLFPLVIAFSLFATLRLLSGQIIQPQFNFDVNIWVYRPLGQTFTAEDSKISSIGFEVEGFRGTPGYASTRLTYELREGVGTNGQLLASVNFTLPTTFSGYADADFSSVTLTVGQLYTVMILASNPSFLVGYNDLTYSFTGHPIPGRIDYTGGEAIFEGLQLPNADLTFRIQPLQPTIACPTNRTVECGASTTVTVPITAPNPGNFKVVWTLNGAAVQTNLLAVSTTETNVSFSAVLPLGTNQLDVTVSDTAGNSAPCSTTITAVDTTPPVIQSVTASPEVLWPPNHQLVPVHLHTIVNDECGPATWRIISVANSETEDASTDTAPDWEITGDDTVLLRAERSGKGNGRLYTITVQARDLSGNSSQGFVSVSVPHDGAK